MMACIFINIPRDGRGRVGSGGFRKQQSVEFFVRVDVDDGKTYKSEVMVSLARNEQGLKESRTRDCLDFPLNFWYAVGGVWLGFIQSPRKLR